MDAPPQFQHRSTRRRSTPSRRPFPEAIEASAGWLDAIQQDIVERHVRTGVDLLATDAEFIDFDSEDAIASVDILDRNARINAYTTATLRKDESVERLKVRTGSQRTDGFESAILGSRFGADQLSDLMLDEGVIEPIEASVDAGALQDSLRDLLDLRSPNAARTPGFHCYLCPRPATCGQYPPTSGSRVGSNQRTILISKTDLLNLRSCERRIAWKRVYAIPQRPADDEIDAFTGRGISFHEIIAIALLADDPDAAFEAQLETVDSSEHAGMRFLWDRHNELDSRHEHFPRPSDGARREAARRDSLHDRPQVRLSWSTLRMDSRGGLNLAVLKSNARQRPLRAAVFEDGPHRPHPGCPSMSTGGSSRTFHRSSK